MKCYVLMILSVWISFVLASSGEMKCIHSHLCDCLKSNELEYQCPKRDFKVVVHTVPEKYMEIDCHDHIPEYNLDLFPNIDIGDLEYFILKYCPLPSDSFNNTLEKFNISKVIHMLLEEVYFNDNKTITKELFYGLPELKSLELKYLQIKLEDNFLEYLPNLTALYLDNSEMSEIHVNTFKYVPKLRVLHLTRHSLSHLPDGIFENLSDLQQLHLWQNKLTYLNNKSFIGLKHLKSLELSNNKISSLDEDTFAELVELVNISLRSNNLQVLTPNTFKHNTVLESIRIGDNPNLNLSDYAFANLTNLLKINIDNSNLELIPAHIFEGCVNLTEISLKNNIITDLPETVFKSLSKLNTLYLDGNKIKILPNNIFSSLINLEKLYVQENNLEEINDVLLRKTIKLLELNLRYNNISTIHLNAFINLKRLTHLDLSYNEYDLFYGEGLDTLNPFSGCVDLKNLDLSHNKLETFPENIMDSHTHLVSLDLSYNNISSVRMASLIKVSSNEVSVIMSNNSVSVVDFQDIKLYPIANPQSYDTACRGNSTSTVLYLSNNPIRCDCSNYDLISYNNGKLDPVIKCLVDIRIGDLHCATPDTFSHIEIRELKPHNIGCPIYKGCPKKCQCNFRPYDEHAVVNCSFRNLESPPLIDSKELNLRIELNLEGNNLQTAPYQGLGYEKVTRLNLSNNRIKNISWVPPQIETLNLHGNKLAFIDSKILDILNESTTLNKLTLYGNPWSCGCSASTLQNYLRNHFKTVNSTDVICADNNAPKHLIERKELCKSNLVIAMAIAVPILIVLFTAATVVALYFYYQEQIKVWLYAKNLCLWCVTEEELDKDKTYDVFVSYSHKDEDFVLQNLLPVLEQGPNPFKVCIHIRDWIPGEFIARQVTNSVLDSRRTLVVLSESFLESVWGKMEFRTAHTQAISEGRARVIVVKYGDLNEEKLDNELKSYLKTNTYVEWGDPWFWNKLKYALPHSKSNKIHNNNQKHANIMLKIDDKFELASIPVKHAESTPPVISLDPSLLKDHPLNFKTDATIPPTDVPLIKR